MSRHYTRLEERMQKISHLYNALSILHWDNATYMPLKSSASRSEEIATISCIAHNLLVSSETADLIEQSNDDIHNLDEWSKANLREIERSYIHSASITEDLVKRHSIACSESEIVWRSARKNNDFKTLAPHLEKVVSVTQEISEVKSAKLGLSKYDSLIDEFSPGLKSSDIELVFATLKSRIPEVISKVKQRSGSEELKISGMFYIEKQKKIAHKVMQHMGFDFDKGRLDISTHPFCGGTPHDIRITTRYYENDPFVSLMGVIHETGHSLYEMNLPEKYKNQPVGKALGMAIHESQSLIMEMHVARSKSFCTFLSKIMLEEFGNQEIFQKENLYNILTKVEPGLIRVDADEVTYPMHVILRFEIEQDLFNNKIKVSDIPELWRVKMKEYLDVNVLNDADGCMQDIHWPSGGFGYFPSYTYGAMVAAQLFASAVKKYSNIYEELESGSFASLNQFLNESLRSYGRFYDFDNLLIKATGEKLNPQIFLNYLENKYCNAM